MIRRPPRSTLFPSRRSSDLPDERLIKLQWFLTRVLRMSAAGENKDIEYDDSPTASPVASPRDRSEEHTSELQSRLHLVCRLLLEKKKIIISLSIISDALCQL